ncbi:MAG: phosphotransferase [Deltaproteobacteria bacterium]|nr:phosphotransferase [Deltaproteobacteria bacterium]MBW2307744.1 phosphotransferase [Deltaproteobacteria bacterium]
MTPAHPNPELLALLEKIPGARGIPVEQWTPLAGDGSDRLIWRAGKHGDSVIVVHNQNPPQNALGITENDSFLYIRRHLENCGVPVPRLLGAGEGGRWMILEYLGDTLLQDEVRLRGGNRTALRELYAVVLDYLPRIQVAGGQGFDHSKVHNVPYTAGFAREWESGYFLREFVQGHQGLRVFDPGLDRELDMMAEEAAPSVEPYFLYRDFQSRNIMWQDGKPRFIDFQGGRTGPLAYDLASIVLDPYVNLSEALREELVELYLERLSGWISMEFRSFRRRFPLVAAHRIMQSLGAYGYLARVKGRMHFLQYIPAALSILGRISQSPELRAFGRFRALVDRLQETNPSETTPCSF